LAGQDTATPGSGNVALIRGLGLFAATSINIANMIGTGVFLKARVMTCNVGTPFKVIAVWVAAGLLALGGALTYSELAAMMPRAGGEYVFLREAYGRLSGFVYGWTQFFIARTGSQAALAVGFAIFLNVLTKGALKAPYFAVHLGSYEIPFGPLQIVALSAIAVTTLINCAAVSVSGSVASLLTILKVLLVLAMGVGAFLRAPGDWIHFAMSNVGGACEGVLGSARGGFAGFGAAMLGALWAYDGWNNVTPLAGEVRNPQRNIPLAFVGGMIVVGALYIFVNLAYFYVLSPTQIANVPASSSVATEVAVRFLGGAAVSAIAVALMTSSFGALHASIVAAARVPYAMARDRLFFRRLGELSPRGHVPVKALVAQAAWASLLALSGSYDTLTDYAIFALWIFYGLVTSSVFVFRRRMPDAERPYRTWGYPVVPVVFLLVTAWLIVNTLIATPVQALIGLVLIVLGLPAYWYWSRQEPLASNI
jgi:APA family basic amino acid/polyamine antiporter